MFSSKPFPSLCRSCLHNPFPAAPAPPLRSNVRYASLGSAINRGKGAHRQPWSGRGNVRKREREATQFPPKKTWNAKYGRHPPKVKPPNYLSTAPIWDYNSVTQHKPGDGTVPEKIYSVAPKIIPYATAASEFIYGTSAVRAAIKCGRRKIYTLYIHDEGLNKPITATRWEEPEMKSLQKFALLRGARVRRITGNWPRMLDKMSNGRPHNGIILDASPLPKLPAVNLQPVESSSSTEFRVTVAKQAEEEAEINGTDGLIRLSPYRRTGLEMEHTTPPEKPARYPFTLLLDGVLDPGNLGGILRSAHFFGVDAVAFAARNSAPLSPVTMKASAGAAESIPLISVNSTTSFISESRKNGWRFIAAEAPGSADSSSYAQIPGRHHPRSLSTSELSDQLRHAPCVLMLGGEGTGLTKRLSSAADTTVALPGAYTDNPDEDMAGVDSLNVNVAAGLLCEAFFREWAGNVGARKNPLANDTQQAQAAEDGEDVNRVF